AITVTHIITILAVPAPIDAGPNVSICGGDLVTIAATNPLGVPIVWSPIVPAGPFAPTQTTTYTVTADNLGCFSTDSVTITVETIPTVNFSGDILSGCETHAVSFTNNSSAPSGLVDCEWIIDGQTISNCGNISYNFTNAGTYDITLTVTSATGCSATETYLDYIYVESAPMASFTQSSTQLTNYNGEVIFSNNSVGASTYVWDFGDNTIGSTDTDPVHTFATEDVGVYVVEMVAYSSLGCSDTVWATISVVEELIFCLPNTFTPDGDSYNEYFTPVFTSGYDPYDFDLLIFNRWGEIIWESHDASVGWDGTYGGKLVQTGTYSWKIEFKTTANDERIMVSGHVNVIR
ncbi:MAG: gliding motility-associated C-terminal domain-containing protein, partial [Crocinitomicaceae bacterium]|nr:gliding motility-associated C-terminal domain-containing protein [Crocinitomicaceae bacterium]